MRYRTAKKLHNEDEVVRKSDNRAMRVVEVHTDEETRTVVLTLEDGNRYVHTEVK